MSRNSLLEAGAKSEAEVTATGLDSEGEVTGTGVWIHSETRT